MRSLPSFLVALLAVAVVFSGCTGEPETGLDLPTEPPIAAGRGAITGLLIDDVYRPIPGGLILLQGAGLTATTDEQGVFRFLDLLPGTYFAVANAAGHDAAPVNVDVEAGRYAELEISARRLSSAGGHIITTQYSVFIPCAADYVVNGIIVGCLADSSGDSWRPGFKTDVTDMGSNITYMVHEAKMNQVGDYDLQVRENNGGSSGGERYAVAFMRQTDYMKIVNQFGVKNEVQNEQGNNVPWNNTKAFDILVFMSGDHREELHGVSETTCNQTADDLNRQVGSPVRTCNWRGVGAQFGIKATFIQSLFVGEPEVDIETYQVLSASV